MLFEWLKQMQFEYEMMLVGLFLLGVAVGCGGVLLIQWLLAHVSISVH